MDNVTGDAIGTDLAAILEGPMEAWATRYPEVRSRLLDVARAMEGPRHKEMRSLVVMDALDLYLKHKGLLPADAPLVSELLLERRRKEKVS